MRLIATLAILLCSTAASAITTSADYSDMWWNPNESGWGANMIQQEDVIFVTFFVYDSTGKPTWFVACLLYTSPSPRDRTRSRMPSSA